MQNHIKRRSPKTLRSSPGFSAGNLVAGLLVSAAFSIANSQELELTDAEKAFVEDHPVIRVHNEIAWPPYNFNVNGQPTGFSIDYMNLVAKRAGLSVEYITGPSWDEFKVMIQSDELDVMLNTTESPERREIVNFTRPYAQISAAIIVKDPDLRIRSIDDLRGLRVAATRGFSTEEYFAELYPDVELILEDNLLTPCMRCLKAAPTQRWMTLPR